MNGGFDLEKEIVLYFGHYLKAVQKVSRGYHIAIDERIVPGNEYGYSYAFVSTKATIPEGTSFVDGFITLVIMNILRLMASLKKYPVSKSIQGKLLFTMEILATKIGLIKTKFKTREITLGSVI